MSYGLLPAVICLVFGSALVILEVMLPGFGLPGISGIVLLCGGTFFLGKVVGATIAVIVMACLLIVLAVIAFAILHSAARGKLFQSRLFLKAKDLGEESGGAGKDLTGLKGRASSALRPAGIGEFDGDRYSVVSEGAFIAEGTLIEVLREERGSLVVRAVSEKEGQDR
ncbi:MAG: hypothetical protein IJ573_11330 [Clostridia bacterium]|nr:hypothetical protein [Clostridia bacterium]